MIVDKNGRLFEDRRKRTSDRRVADEKKEPERRVAQRRKCDNKTRGKKKKK